MVAFLFVPDRAIRSTGLRLRIIGSSVVPTSQTTGGDKHLKTIKKQTRSSHFHKRRKQEKWKQTYANRSMIGAQFLVAMRERRSRRALLISFKYSASTIDAAIADSFYSSGNGKSKRSNETEKWSIGFTKIFCFLVNETEKFGPKR